MDLPLRINGSLLETDLLSPARYTFWRRSRAAKLLMFVSAVWVVAAIATIVTSGFASAAGAIAASLFMIGYLLYAPTFSVKRQLKASASLREEAEYVFDKEEFTINRPSVKVTMRWSEVHGVVELKDVLTVYTTKNCFFSIPKRLFDDVQLNQFREFLRGTSGKLGTALYESGTGWSK